MSATENLSAIVVTFNRRDMVADTIEKVLSQTLPVTRIYLVNNASTDGTEEHLARLGYTNHPKIEYINLSQNIGGAGGFRLGMERAYQDGADWLWLMDDDIAPHLDCLERLLFYRTISSCIHPLIVYQDGTEHEWEHIFEPSTTYQVGLRNQSFRNGKDWCSMSVACFEGMLISRDVVGKIGFPDGDFFIYSDDGHYGFLANLHTNVIYTRSGIFEKKIKPVHEQTPFRIYYDVRNRFLMKRKLRGVRNYNRYEKAQFLAFMLAHTKRMTSSPRSFAKVRAAFWAWMDGVRGLSGKRRY